MPELRAIQTTRATIRCAIAGSGPLVLMVHGFPESWYSWRHQLGPVAAAGFMACALDVRGYGGSTRFGCVAEYALEPIVADLAGVADALSPGRPAILIGHDWGAPIVYAAALTRPERFAAVAGLSVPWAGVPERSFDEIITERYDRQGQFFYQSYFRDPGRAEAVLEADPRKFIRRFLYAISGDAPRDAWPSHLKAGDDLVPYLPDPPGPLPWLSETDLDVYTAEFTGSGFFGPLSRYRNHTRDFEWLRNWRGKVIEQPALLIGGDRDPAYTLFGAASDPGALMRQHAPNLTAAHTLPGCGHWTQQERPAQVTALILDWLTGLR